MVDIIDDLRSINRKITLDLRRVYVGANTPVKDKNIQTGKRGGRFYETGGSKPQSTNQPPGDTPPANALELKQDFTPLNPQSVIADLKSRQLVTIPEPLQDKGFITNTMNKYRRQSPGKGGSFNFTTPEELSVVLNHGSFALLSAGKNPKREAHANLPPEEFARRHAELRKDLIAKGYAFTEVLGKYGELEDTFLVMAMDPDKTDMVELGKKYDQDSIILSNAGRHAMLYTTDSSNDDGPVPAGSYIGGSSFHQTGPGDDEDFFTEIRVDGTYKSRFTIDFDWVVRPPTQ